MGKGQYLLLQELSKKGIKTYCISGDQPYNSAVIFSFQTNKAKKVNSLKLLQINIS